MGKAEGGKIAPSQVTEGHCQITNNLFNVLPALGDIQRQSSSATPPAHHQTGKSLFYRVYASIFVQRWQLHTSTWLSRVKFPTLTKP